MSKGQLGYRILSVDVMIKIWEYEAVGMQNTEFDYSDEQQWGWSLGNNHGGGDLLGKQHQFRDLESGQENLDAQGLCKLGKLLRSAP